ncbi:MAG: hypothetical protein LBS92_00920 [Candidatus Methanoplasma sp.]|jgi:hypothetical protein|nr:hypothetical protein [Candidatus Methanoplasma sp.]
MESGDRSADTYHKPEIDSSDIKVDGSLNIQHSLGDALGHHSKWKPSRVRTADAGCGFFRKNTHLTERTVYDIIVNGDGLTTKEISHLSSIPIRTTYCATDILVERGLIREVNKWGGKWVANKNHND